MDKHALSFYSEVWFNTRRTSGSSSAPAQTTQGLQKFGIKPKNPLTETWAPGNNSHPGAVSAKARVNVSKTPGICHVVLQKVHDRDQYSRL
jgi:hypothetical protein